MYFGNCTPPAYIVFDRPFWIFSASFPPAGLYLHRSLGCFSKSRLGCISIYVLFIPGAKAVGNGCPFEGGLSLPSWGYCPTFPLQGRVPSRHAPPPNHNHDHRPVLPTPRFARFSSYIPAPLQPTHGSNCASYMPGVPYICPVSVINN